MNQINQDSNSLSIGFAPLQIKTVRKQQKKSTKHLNLEQTIQQLNHKLITTIQIISSKQIHSSQFRKQLKNYRFQRKSKSTNLFNDASLMQEKQIQHLFFALKDLFSTWRDNLKNKFHIAFSNGDLIYFFHKSPIEDQSSKQKKGGSFAIISCKKTDYSSILQSFKIQFSPLEKKQYLLQQLLLRNNFIQLFYKYLVNEILQRNINFEVVSNFCFMNSSEIYPIEKFNGKQKRHQFDHVAENKTNVLGQVKKELYSIKIEGYWIKQNIQKAYKKILQILQRKPFQILFQCHAGSQQLGLEIDRL